MSASAERVAEWPGGFEDLAEIAGNLWWSWQPAARMLFKRLDRGAWKTSGHNPVKMLGLLSSEQFAAAAGSPEWRRLYDDVTKQFRRACETDRSWLGVAGRDGPLRYPFAYFSAEYGLHHSLPFYAGGLGFLAGDFLKEMSDLGVPMVGVGFMYPEGYVRQRIREDGWQESEDQVLDRTAASISRVPDREGRPLTVRVPLVEPAIHVAVWKIAVGGIPLFLLDTDTDLNDPRNRNITQRLYTGDVEQRLRQEIVLGLGGSAVLSALGIEHAALHFNEGHAAFALLERVRNRVSAGLDFAAAAARVAETSAFTMHTPVPAGEDVFPFALVEKYLRSYWPALGIGKEEFMRLGIRPGEPAAGFDMTALALRLSGWRNAVSRRHGEVSRRMWHGLWPGLPEDKVPIGSITNGVHLATWVSPRTQGLFKTYLGPDWIEKQDDPGLWEGIDKIPDEELWAVHFRQKIKLVNGIREMARRRWAVERAGASLVLAEGAFLEPDVLTVGFARRFATYKRADLILTDPVRLKRILCDPARPVQIIFAGKAHPADEAGKRLLQKVITAARDPDFGGRVAFVEDYGEQFAQYMVHGVDVWLNNPLPPNEACGTSGMKAAVNGVPQLSILDGWWPEGYNGKNGWAFGGPGDALQAPGEDRNAADAASLYEILERDVVPLYYRSGGVGVPREWVKVMKESIKAAAPQFCARRMAREYISGFYAQAIKKT